MEIIYYGTTGNSYVLRHNDREAAVFCVQDDCMWAPMAGGDVTDKLYAVKGRLSAFAAASGWVNSDER